MIALDVGCGDKSTVPVALQAKYVWHFLDKFDFSAKYPAGKFIRHDLKNPLPFPTGSVGFVWSHHCLEHLPPRHPTRDIDYVVWVVNEFYRVLKLGGEAHLIVPWIEHTNAWRAPTHYRFFNHETFAWFGRWRSMPGEHAASGMVGHWKVTRCDVVDHCHVYGILVKEAM